MNYSKYHIDGWLTDYECVSDLDGISDVLEFKKLIQGYTGAGVTEDQWNYLVFQTVEEVGLSDHDMVKKLPNDKWTEVISEKDWPALKAYILGVKPEEFKVKMAIMPDANFYPLGIKPGMPALAIRYPGDSWTTVEYTSIKAMNNLSFFGAYEVSGVTIQLCNTIVKGTDKSSEGLELWTKPALAFSGSAPLTECENFDGEGGKVVYLLPVPSVDKPIRSSMSVKVSVGGSISKTDKLIMDVMSNWTGKNNWWGKPRLRGLSAMVGFKVTRRVRNRLWKIIREGL